MNWYIKGSERLKCPPEFQDHVNAIGGFNRFGDPNFRIVWGQSEFEVVRGVDAAGKSGAHIVSKHADVPAWFIEIWHPPEFYGTPEFWYALTWDWDADAPQIGEYPWRGAYEAASFNLFVRRFEGDCLIIDAMPLNHYIIDLIVPNLMKGLEETYEQRKIAIRGMMNAEKAQTSRKAYDAYLDAHPAFGNRAGTHESNRQAWEQRILEKQAGMKISAEQIKRKMGTGHRQF